MTLILFPNIQSGRKGGDFIKANSWKALTAVPALLITLYVSGYISQFMYNYQIWTQGGGYSGDGSAPAFPSGSPLVCYKSLLIFPYGLYGFFICLGTFFVLIVFVMRIGRGGRGDYDRERRLTYSNRGTYGTSGFMERSDIPKVLDLVSNIKNERGTILGALNGKLVCVPENSRMNKNIAVYGASGSMKSRAYARNMVFQCVKRGESLIITDPKQELYEDMSQYLKNCGYTVKVFDLINPEHSDSWNCLSEIEGQELMAQLFVDVIIKNTGSALSEHFWDNSELNLLKALVLYVEQGFPPEGKNIGQVYRLLTLNSERELNSIFDALPFEHPAKAPYSIFKQAADTVRGGIIIGLGSRLQVFQNQLIRMITSFDEIDLTLPGKERCAYFCITSDQDSTFEFLSSLFLSFLFIKLVRYADKFGDGGKLPVPVHILADELANIGIIPDLTKKISTIRSRNISISVIFQNLAQMQNRYPQNQWQEILGNCDVQLFLGCTDDLTARFISDRTGDVTIGVSSESRRRNTMSVTNYAPEYRQTESIGRRKLMTMDEVMRMPVDEALVILRGQKVLKVDKYDYILHPEAKKLQPSKITEHVPDWRRTGQRELDIQKLVNVSPQTDSAAKTEPSPNPRREKSSNPDRPKAPGRKAKAGTNKPADDPPVSDQLSLYEDKNTEPQKADDTESIVEVDKDSIMF